MRNEKGQFQKGNIEPNRNRFSKGNTLGVKHGLRNHPLHTVWSSMKMRCSNKNSDSWSRYGQRGIVVCTEWHKFEAFYEWAIQSWSKGKQIDRIDNNGNYTPKNCRFVSTRENANNRSNTLHVVVMGEKMSAYEASNRYKIVSPRIIHRRKKFGWSDEEAVLTKKRGLRHKHL